LRQRFASRGLAVLASTGERWYAYVALIPLTVGVLAIVQGDYAGILIVLIGVAIYGLSRVEDRRWRRAGRVRGD